MKLTVKCFLLYSAALIIGAIIIYLLIRFDAAKVWSLSLLPPCVLSWGGLITWNGIPVSERPKYTELLHLNRFLYGLPIGLTLSIVLLLTI